MYHTVVEIKWCPLYGMICQCGSIRRSVFRNRSESRANSPEITWEEIID